MYQELLVRVSQLTSAYGGAMQPPCPKAEIDELARRMADQLRARVPAPYADLLRLHNGIDWNGLCVYASTDVPIVGYNDRVIMGCVEANLLRRDVPMWQEFLALAGTGDEDFCLELKTGHYLSLDAVTLDMIRSFQSFDEMIHEALLQHL